MDSVAVASPVNRERLEHWTLAEAESTFVERTNSNGFE